MAITKSAKKALRQSIRRRAKNLTYKTKIKTLVKKARALALAKKTTEAKQLLPQIYQALDKAAKKAVLKKGAADRKKSRIARICR